MCLAASDDWLDLLKNEAFGFRVGLGRGRFYGIFHMTMCSREGEVEYR